MANEFTARNGIIAKNNSVITGSLIVTQGITGSLFGTASFATSASYALSTSLAQTASYVLNAVSASLATLSQTANTASYVVTAQTASFVTTAQTASYVLNALSASRATSAANADTASYILNAVSSSYALSSSFAISSSLAQTASFVTLAQTASYILNAVSASRSISSANADTASFVTLAQTASYVQNAISASYIVTAQTASYVLNAVSSSFATSASYALKAVSASIATSAVTADTADKADQVRVIDNVNSLLYFPLIASSSAGYQQVTTTANISYDTDNSILIAESFQGIFQGNLEGTANDALSAQTASYVLNAVSSSLAQTASYVNTLNQNVLISGSLTVGSGSIGPFENTLILGARDSVNEGGQLVFNAPGGTYTSASFIALDRNRLSILKGTNSTTITEAANWSMHNLQMQLPAYNSVGAFPGTVAGLLAFDSSGNIITAATSSGGGSTSPGGSNTQIQYNNGSAFGGVSTLTFDGTTLRATGSFTGSLTGALVGTASWASNAVTASYVLNAVSSSFARSSSFATSASYASVTLANVLATGNTTNNQVITSNNASSSISVNDNYIDIVRDDRNILISDTAIVITEGTFGSSIELLEGDALVNFTGRFAANGEDVITSSSLNTALATKQNTLTLTTTGTSGAATLVSGTLNIPQYTGGGGAAFPYTGDASISGSLTVTGSLIVSGSSLKIDIPSKANGYVLTSDASGNATWAASSGSGAASTPAIRKAQPRITRETYY